MTDRDLLHLVPEGARALEEMGLTVTARPSGEGMSLTLSWGGDTKWFAIVPVPLATPKRLREALTEAQSQGGAAKVYPMLVVPHLTEEASQTLIDAGVSGMDPSGNVAVVVPGEWLVVRTGRPNSHPSSRPIRDVYSGTSALVGRALLRAPVHAQVQGVRDEVLRRGGVISLGTVSKVLAVLAEDLIIDREGGVRLVQPAKLLDRLEKNYRGPGVRRRLVGCDTGGLFSTLPKVAGEVGERVAVRDEGAYAVGASAGARRVVYVSDLGRWVDALPFNETDRFPDVELVEARDPGVFFDIEDRDGLPLCSALQIYLELVRGGKRERDTAAQIRPDLLPMVAS